MKDENKLYPLLRVFKMGHVDIEYSVDYILKVYSSSRRFNWPNFSLGIVMGLMLMQLIMLVSQLI